jgi:lipid-A-disaccharide synthase
VTDILVVAPEASGDRYAAGVVRALAARAPDVRVFGVGGPALEAAGTDLVARAEDIAVTGLWEAMARVPAVLRALGAVRRAVAARRPAAALLVDSPDFNLRLVAHLARAGTRVVYYVSPQVWAWRAGRVRRLARFVDRLCVIFPFEVAFHAARGVAAQFVGHPLVDEVAPAGGAADAREDAPIVGLLPGSRPSELRRHLGPLVGAARRIVAARPDVRLVLPVAPTLDAASIRAACAGVPIDVTPAPVREALRGARMALTASGTATVELCLMDVAMVVFYRVAWPTWWLARRLVRVPHIAMVNLLAGRAVVPELLQRAVTPESLAAAALRLLEDGDARDAQRRAFAEVRATLGPPGAAARVADALLAAS